MGTTCHFGFNSVKDLHNHNIERWNNNNKKILASTLKGSVGYYAVHDTDKDDRFIVVVKYSKYENEVCEKIMDESVNPYYYDVPLKYIKLTEKTNHVRGEYAINYRNGVIEYYETKKKLKSIVLENGYEFTLYDRLFRFYDVEKRHAYEIRDGKLWDRVKLNTAQMQHVKAELLAKQENLATLN